MIAALFTVWAWVLVFLALIAAVHRGFRWLTNLPYPNALDYAYWQAFHGRAPPGPAEHD